MNKRVAVVLVAVFFLGFGIPEGFARGNQIIPHIVDGPTARTVFKLTNISGNLTNIGGVIYNKSIEFFHQDGTPWQIMTSSGNQPVSKIRVGAGVADYLPPSFTIKIETLGQSPVLTTGYAVVRDNEDYFPSDSSDSTLGIWVAYQITTESGSLVDVVNVPEGTPTRLWALPIWTDASQDIYDGIAILNLEDRPVKVNLELWQTDPQAIPLDKKDGFTLNPKQQVAGFIGGVFFRGLTKYKGTLRGRADGAVAVIALTQNGSGSGVQYSTLEPKYMETLRRNSFLYLPEAQELVSSGLTKVFTPVDVDELKVDSTAENIARTPGGRTSDDAFSWDFVYETDSTGARKAVPKNGAKLAVIPVKTGFFISPSELRSLTFSDEPIDFSNGSRNLVREFTFAVKTDLGRYAKVRVVNVFTHSNTPSSQRYTDLLLEVFVQR